MDFKKSSKKLLCMYLLFLSCGHGTCYRTFFGNVSVSSIEAETMKIIFESKYYGKFMYPDTIIINDSGYYTTDKLLMDPQSDCENNCSNDNTTFPEATKIRIINTETMKTVIDTIFSCEDYKFKGDDIELPTITLP